MSEIVEHNENNYREFEYETAVAVIRFYATWCTSCVKNAPFYEQLAQLFDASVKFGKVNVNQSSILTLRYQVFGLLTTLIFKDERIVERLSSNVSVAQLQ
ncbi:thioredoxin family protein [Acinetobacter towneri]|uniref:thioredoxin family protein n=1 Tax=Acinetobacter towneri TaxID=202956 RepID=UPI001F4408C0|nr:thioredoxin family protein [Acinetobacter towneri]UIP25891.1 thioredoxin family protein [Acinetobacter towneri]